MSRTGSIKRSGSTWGFVLDVGRNSGRRQQVRKRGFRTRKDAQTALNDALAALQHGTYVRPQRVAFGAYLDDWLAMLVATGRRPTTIADYRRQIRLHVKPALGDLPIQEITPVLRPPNGRMPQQFRDRSFFGTDALPQAPLDPRLMEAAFCLVVAEPAADCQRMLVRAST